MKRPKGCERKVAHPDRHSAFTAMSQLANRTGTRFAVLQIYRCPYKRPPHWHVGHKRRGKP